jgi:hypothetical protein
MEHGYGHSIDLISIALVAEDDRSLYLVNASCDLTRVSPWVAEHVLPKLPPLSDERWLTHEAIRDRVQLFVGDDPAPEFWAYCAAYDWVVLCQLFGTMTDRPSNWPKYSRDVRQEADRLGVNLREVTQEESVHDALADAEWCRTAWQYLADMSESTAREQRMRPPD